MTRQLRLERPLPQQTWWDRDPDRLTRDRTEITERFPSLVWNPEGAGGWDGVLPSWPFDRPKPPLLDALIDGVGLRVAVRYPQGYPMVPPAIWPLNPEPSVAEWTVHAWHVNGDGSLCMLESVSLWDPRESPTPLLLKAAGWRIEYALRKADVLSEMTRNGIVSDDRLDELITSTGKRRV